MTEWADPAALTQRELWNLHDRAKNRLGEADRAVFNRVLESMDGADTTVASVSGIATGIVRSLGWAVAHARDAVGAADPPTALESAVDPRGTGPAGETVRGARPARGYGLSDGVVRLSVSQMGKWRSCPRSWEYQYLRGLRTPPGATMCAGIALHRAIETHYREVMAGGPGCDEARIVSVARAELGRELSGAEAKHGENSVEWEDGDTAETLERDVGELAAKALAEVLPRYRPFRVEHEFTLDGPIPGLDDAHYRILGYIDLLADGGGLLVDWKLKGTKGFDPDPSRVDLQLSCYSVEQIRLAGLPAEAETKARIHVFRRKLLKRGRELSLDAVDFAVLPSWRSWFLRAAGEVARAVALGATFPNPNGWHCSPRFCPGFADCMGAATF